MNDHLLNTLNQLPALSIAVRQVIASFSDQNLDSHELATRISHDQGMSARILRVANSPFYGLMRQVGSIHEAVMVLGFNSVRSIALAAGISSVFPAATGAFSWPDYWRRSMLTGIYAKALAGCLALDRETAFSAGLFNDIGLAVLAYGAPELLAEARAAVTEEVDLLGAERAVLSFDHALLGGEVARRWNFPPAIEAAIRFHHQADGGEGEPLVLVTRVAHLLAAAVWDDRAADTARSVPLPLLAALELTLERLSACLPPLEEAMAASAAILPSDSDP